MSTLHVSRFEPLQKIFRGDVLVPGSLGYDDARTVWNAMIDKRPAAIARCTCVDDVVAAVSFGRAQNLTVAIRGGGHNIAGNALCDGGLVIDLSPMNGVSVDAGAQRVRVGPGATLADIDRETAKFGLVVPTGINSTTGIAGLTLGGGIGWLSRRLGLTIDSLVGADVVTADGCLRRASAGENPDLFWALRGGGGNFGVVTSFEFRAHAVGPNVLAGLIVFPLAEAKRVLKLHRVLMANAPRELNVWAVLRKAPPLPFLPPQVHGQNIVALAICHSGDPEDGERLIKPIRHFGHVLGEHIGVQPFSAWQQAFDPLLMAGARNYWKSHDFWTLPDGALDTVISHAAQMPSPQCEIFIGVLGGAVAEIPVDATAYAGRLANFVMNVHCRWESAADDPACISWARAFHRAAAPFAAGSVYVNFMTADETDRVGAAYGPNLGRLAEIKASYDPENFFHVNHNIKPAPRG